MKIGKKIKRILTLILASAVFLTNSLQSFAWVTAEGESGNLSSFKSTYSIHTALQGWIIYWVDDSSSVVSDVKVVDTIATENQFATASYDVIRTRFGDCTPSGRYDISTLGMPLPYNDPMTNAPAVKAWIKEHGIELVDNLNAPQEIKTCTEEDQYFFIAEPVYMFSLFSNVEGVPRRTIVGTTYQYSNFILGLIGTADYPSSATLFGSATSRGLTEYGWWGTCKYTNGLFGTFECVGNDYLTHTAKIGITKAGEDYFNIDFSNHPLNFSELANASIGLGIVVMSNSDKGEIPASDLITSAYVGQAKPDTWTYNYANGFNLNKYNDPRGRIPSGEMLTNGINVDKWYCDYAITKHAPPQTGYSNLRKKVSVTYNIHWTAIDSYTSTEDGEYFGKPKGSGLTMDEVEEFIESEGDNIVNPIVDPISATKYKVDYYGKSEQQLPYTTYVTRESYYYTIDRYNVYTFNKAVITCESEMGISAYTGGQVIYNGNYDVSYSMKKTGKIVHLPVNTTVDIWADDYEDGKHIAEGRKLEDADDYIVQNDYLEVGGVKFVPNTQGQHGADYIKVIGYDFPNTGVGTYETGVTIPFTDPNDYYYTSAIYTYKNVLEPSKGVTIQKLAPETHSSHTASIDERIHANFRQNEPVFVHTPVVADIDTSGSSEVQLVSSKVNDIMVDYQLRLDNTYTFQFDIEAHLNLLGYSPDGYEWDYAKYVKKAQVLFPFDVAIVSNPSGDDVYTYYKAKTWIDVDYLVPTTYYIPSWAIETSYDEIYFRTIAYNIDEYLSEDEYSALEQETHNLIPSNYVAYTKVAIQLSGYVYDLMVVGANDSIQLEFKDELSPVQLAYQKKEFRAGTNNRLGTNQVRFEKDSLLTGDWDVKYTLPFANGSNLYSNIAGTLGKGTKLAFSVKTMANCWNENDKLVIIPRLRYVSSDGIEYDYDDTRIFYSVGDTKFVEIGSERDINYDMISGLSIPTKLTDPLFSGSYKDSEIDRTIALYNRINGTDYETGYVVTNSGNKRFLGTYAIETNNGIGTKNYTHLGLITIPNTLKMYTGDEEDLSYNYNREGINVIRLDNADRHIDIGNSSYDSIFSSNGAQVAGSTTELMYASMQTWYGEWILPPNIYIAFASDVEQYGDVNYDGVIDLQDYAEWKWRNEDGLKENDPMWLKTGYLVLNFEIYVRKNGEDHLTYYSNVGTFSGGAETVHGQNMMRTENAKASFNEIVYVGGKDNVPVTLQTGDVAIFDMRTSTHDYFDVGVGWTN